MRSLDEMSREELIEVLRSQGEVSEVAAPVVADEPAVPSLDERIRNARSAAELDALLRAEDRAGRLPGREHSPRRVGSGAPSPEEIKAIHVPMREGMTVRERMEAESAALDALLRERVGDADVYELGLAENHEG